MANIPPKSSRSTSPPSASSSSPSATRKPSRPESSYSGGSRRPSASSKSGEIRTSINKTRRKRQLARAQRILTTKSYLLPSSLAGRPKIRKPRRRGIYLAQPGETQLTEYEPYFNRTDIIAHPTTNCETLLHLLKCSMGTGVLAMPNAFINTGYIVGTVTTILVGLLSTYTIHILLESCHEVCKRRKIPLLSYTGIAEASMAEGPLMFRSYAPYAATTVNVFLIVYELGVSCVYVLFAAENFQVVLAKQFNIVYTVHQVMLIILVPMILLNYVRDLKYLAPFSGIANIATLISFAIIMYYIFKQPMTGDVTATGRVLKYPLFLGTVMFALEAVGVIIPLENEMKTPQAFTKKTGVLNIAMAFIISLYIFMGLSGYLCYGSAALGSVTLNLPSDTDMLAGSVQILLGFAIFVSYTLGMYVVIDIVWTDYLGAHLLNNRFRRFWEYVLRTFIVLFTFAVAAAVPELDLIISLYGALCLSALGYAFPAIIQTCAYWHYVKGTKRVRMAFKNALIILFGLVGLIIGTWTAIDAIVDKLT